MKRIVVGAVGALLLASAGLFWWQGRAESESAPPLPVLAGASDAAPLIEELPTADGSGLSGPAPPELDPVTREQRRYDRLDRDRDGRVTANEMLAPRVAAFRKLDADHNNLLSFQEWSVRTSNRFKGADANGDNWLTRAEFANTKPKRTQPDCRCTPQAKSSRRSIREPEAPADESGDDVDPTG